jgi:hypothetical protein
MEMRILKSLTAMVCTLIAVAAFATATPARAQQEPHYLQALSDLRTARDYIEFDKGALNGGDRRQAVDEINKAIEEIKHAAWDDGKNTRFAPPAEGVTTAWAPVHESMKWLFEAKKHVQLGVDPPDNAGLRDRAILHISNALHIMDVERQHGRQ